MDDSVLVGKVHGTGDGFEKPGRDRCRLRLAVEQFGQAPPLDKLQRQERAAFVFADFVNLNDIGMLEAGDGLGFGAESGTLLGAGVDAGPEHLQGDRSLQAQVPGLVDDADSAAAALLQDFVARGG